MSNICGANGIYCKSCEEKNARRTIKALKYTKEIKAGSKLSADIKQLLNYWRGLLMDISRLPYRK